MINNKPYLVDKMQVRLKKIEKKSIVLHWDSNPHPFWWPQQDSLPVFSLINILNQIMVGTYGMLVS